MLTLKLLIQKNLIYFAIKNCIVNKWRLIKIPNLILMTKIKIMFKNSKSERHELYSFITINVYITMFLLL